MKRILIIGAGMIGRRHLQSLCRTRSNLNIIVVDPSKEALQEARKIAAGEMVSSASERIGYFTSIPGDSSIFDIAIVATASDIRSTVTMELLRNCTVKSVIFEKILFQKTEEYYEIDKALDNASVNAWVNCPRRVFSCYSELRSRLSGSSEISVNVIGGDWGLACNGIHFVDLLSFLTGITNFEFDTSSLIPKIYNSKRVGFYEIGGTLAARSNDVKLSLTSDRKLNTPVSISVITETDKVVINEGIRIMKFAANESESSWDEHDIDIPYQSDLTGGYVENILAGNNCGLTSYKESMSLHIPYIESIRSFFSETSGQSFDRCPIT